MQTGQDHELIRGETVDVVVTLTGVTLTGSETIQAFWRKEETNDLELTVTATITANGPPAVVTFALDPDDTELVTAPENGNQPSHTFSVERVDAAAETAYSIGEVTVRNTARVGL